MTSPGIGCSPSFDAEDDDLHEISAPTVTTFQRTQRRGVFGRSNSTTIGMGTRKQQKLDLDSPQEDPSVPKDLRVARRSTSTSQLQPPARRKLTRSTSLITTPRLFEGVRPFDGPSFESRLNELNGENSNPNNEIDLAIEKPPSSRRIGRRRHSTLSTAASLPLPSMSDMSRATSSSGSLTSHNTLPAVPAELNWLIDCTPPPTTSPSVRSTTSRKRTGSPISDTDNDWLTQSAHSGSSFSDARRTRSRSRIFSETPADQWPMAPNLNEVDIRDTKLVDSSDDELVSDNRSPDTSFEETFEPEEPQAPDLSLFDADDRAFLITELRKQSQRELIFTSFHVAPRAHEWDSKRRARFTQYAMKLGFSKRSIGMGNLYFELSKTRGTKLLQDLESLDSKPVVDQPSELLFPSGTAEPMDTKPPPPSAMKIDPPAACMDIDDVTNHISNLTMNEPTNVSDMTVTLPQSNKPPRFSMDSRKSRPSTDSYNIQSRFSMESMSSSRPSIESHAQAENVNVHLLGHSPWRPAGRPPKMSLSSTCSSNRRLSTNSLRMSSTPMATSSCQKSVNTTFVRTPLMTDTNWGSRPVFGRDWGTSAMYNRALIDVMIAQFEEACDGTHDSFEAGSLVFDFETKEVTDEDLLNKKEEERKEKKRRQKAKKQMRMSLFASATGTRTALPRKTFTVAPSPVKEIAAVVDPASILATDESIVSHIFGFFKEAEIFNVASTVCTQWTDWATNAHANLLLSSLPREDEVVRTEPPMEWSWQKLHATFPWACFLAEGGAKAVYKVHNAAVGQVEALSVMDTESVSNIQIVANELAVSVMLSSLARRAICPNFILMRGVFTCAHRPLDSQWGDEDNKYPKGRQMNLGKNMRRPKEPRNPSPGRYQYIRMELVNEGDAEELIKRQDDTCLSAKIAQSLLFQIAFSLYAAAEKFSVKHYDVKLLNIFVNKLATDKDCVVMRYGLGAHVFALQMGCDEAFVAKLADFGTADILPGSNRQPVAISHFTTLENTPPEMMILGDDAKQGHEHDNFGLGLCMLHLFTGHAPYEEILDKVSCPKFLMQRLKAIWEDENIEGYSVIRSLIFDGVDKNEKGEIVEGEPDDVFYHTLYKYLVLFGIPENAYQQKTCPRVWKAIFDSLDPSRSRGNQHGRVSRKKQNDETQYNRDCKKYSLRNGKNKYIARARRGLQSIDGGMELLFELCSFDPDARATALRVLNSTFMQGLRETSPSPDYDNARVQSYLSFACN